MDNNPKNKKIQFSSGGDLERIFQKHAHAKSQQHRFPLNKKDERKPFSGFKE